MDWMLAALRHGGDNLARVACALAVFGAVACDAEAPRAVSRAPGQSPPTKIASSLPSLIPSCAEIPCTVSGADSPRTIGGLDPSSHEVFRGWVRDEEGGPVRARIAVFDQSMSQHPDYRSDGAFLAATGTGSDGSFVLRAPPRSPDDLRTFVVESRGGLRNLAELPSVGSRDIVLHPVRALPLTIPLREPPGEGTRAWLVIERTGEDGRSERWAQHTLVHREGAVGRRDIGDSVGGLVSVAMDGTDLRATVLVPVGEVRVGVTLEQSPSGLSMNDLALSVPAGDGALGERSLPVPHPDAGTLELRYRPADPDGCRPWFTLRRVDGTRRVLGANTYQEGGMALRLPASPGRYELGDDADCLETFEVPAGGTRVVTVRRTCAVHCVQRHCGYGEQCPPE